MIAFRLEQIGRESAWQRDVASESQLLRQDVTAINAQLSSFVSTGELP